MEIGQALYMARHSKKMSQEALALEIGSTPKTISNWENGHSFPNADMIDKIGKATGTVTRYFTKVDPPKGD